MQLVVVEEARRLGRQKTGAPVPWCQAGEETTDRIKGLEAQVARLQAALAERDKTVEELQRRGGAKAPSATVRRGSGVCGGSEAPLYFGYFRKHPQCSAGKLLRTQPTVPKAVFDGVSTNSHVRDISVSALVARVDTMCNSLQAEKPIVGGAKHGALTGKGAVTLCKGARGADADEGTTRKDVEDAQRVCPLLKKPSVSETSLPIRSARSGRCRNMCAGMYACMRARASPPCETSRRQRGQSCKVDATESSDMADTTSDEDCFTDSSDGRLAGGLAGGKIAASESRACNRTAGAPTAPQDRELVQLCHLRWENDPPYLREWQAQRNVHALSQAELADAADWRGVASIEYDQGSRGAEVEKLNANKEVPEWLEGNASTPKAYPGRESHRDSLSGTGLLNSVMKYFSTRSQVEAPPALQEQVAPQLRAGGASTINS